MKLDQSSSWAFEQKGQSHELKTNTAERFGGDENQDMAQEVVQATTS
ncbi:hypothetical protein [Vibrio navarrensis]|nr:hypothetical protein [Vibrio navarrensis]